MAKTESGLLLGVGKDEYSTSAVVGASKSGRVQGTNSTYSVDVLVQYTDSSDPDNVGNPEGWTYELQGEVQFGGAKKVASVDGRKITIAEVREITASTFEKGFN